MKERPMLMKGEMVRAILEGRKTQTRRILDLPTGWDFKASEAGPCILGRITSPHPKKDRFGAFIRREIYKDSGKFEHDIVPCKYGEPGDRLWVRETFGYRDDGRLYYQADQTLGQLNVDRWKPSIHMPRNLSRITLEVTDVRVERLKDISAKDALAEGVDRHLHAWVDYQHRTEYHTAGGPRSSFATLWQSINGVDSWSANPWVWAIEFRRVQEMEKAA